MKTFLTLIISLIVAGCCPTPERVVVKETKIQAMSVPKTLLNKCQVPPPVKTSEYIGLGNKDKEGVLTNYTISLLGSLNNCNSQLAEIESYLNHQAKLLENKK